jgi:hypothetical protein
MIGHLIANAYEAMPGEDGTIIISTSTDARGGSSWNFGLGRRDGRRCTQAGR